MSPFVPHPPPTDEEQRWRRAEAAVAASAGVKVQSGVALGFKIALGFVLFSVCSAGGCLVCGLGSAAAVGSSPSASKSPERIDDVAPRPNAPPQPTFEEAYVEKISIRGARMGRTGLNEPAVFGEIKNTGNRTLKAVQVAVVALDQEGRPVYEATQWAVADIAFDDRRQPLKPNYSRKFGVGMEAAPSDWARGKFEVKVTKVEFANEP